MNQPSNKKIIADDRLSILPEALIFNILGHMNIKYAVQTCILSRRWNRIWTKLPTLNINPDIFESLDSFKNFLLYLFIHHDASELYRCSFSSREDYWDNPIVGAIIDYAVSNRVKDLRIQCFVSYKEHFEITPRVLACQSLKILVLDDVCIPELPSSFSLTNLRLHKVCISSYDLLLNCANLEHFAMIDCSIVFSHDIIISCPKLVNLTISYEVLEQTALYEIKISAPKLVSFDLSAEFWYNFVISLDKCPALESLMMDLCVPSNINEIANLIQRRTYAMHIINFLKELSITKSLTLAADIVKVLSEFPDLMENLPTPFRNLKVFKLIKCCGSKSLIICPEVKTFLFDGPQTVIWEL